MSTFILIYINTLCIYYYDKKYIFLVAKNICEYMYVLLSSEVALAEC